MFHRKALHLQLGPKAHLHLPLCVEMNRIVAHGLKELHISVNVENL